MTGFPRVVADWDRLAERARWMPAAVAECEAVEDKIGKVDVLDAEAAGYLVKIPGCPPLFVRWGTLRTGGEAAR